MTCDNTIEPEISEKDWEAIEKVKAFAGVEDDTAYSTPFNILRWIYAYEYNLEEASQKYRRHLNIRKILGLDNILNDNFEGNIDEDADKYAPLTIMDKVVSKDDNRILVIERTGMFDLTRMMENIKTTPFIMNRFRLMEIMMKKIMEVEKKTGKMSGCVLLFDMKGLKFQSNLISILTGPYRIMWGTLIEQYPYFYTKMIVVNAPKFINVLYSACAAFVPQEYRSRMNILNDNWKETITEHIDPNSLPTYYGGTIVDPNGCEMCSSIVTIPDSSPFNTPYDIKIDKQEIGILKEYAIPAGGILSLTYHLEEGDLLELYILQSQEFTFNCVYTENKIKIDKKDQLKLYPEAHMGCERPGLSTIDHFKWLIPKSGYYHFVYGNEKAWIFSVKFELKAFVISNYINGERKRKVLKVIKD
uniref:CRAL-TRIO domain-containing protein n=1 Tax=Strongyloides papillosus TaxID=174720 RepID=A0A0N5CHW5_STREA